MIKQPWWSVLFRLLSSLKYEYKNTGLDFTDVVGDKTTGGILNLSKCFVFYGSIILSHRNAHSVGLNGLKIAVQTNSSFRVFNSWKQVKNFWQSSKDTKHSWGVSWQFKNLKKLDLLLTFLSAAVCNFENSWKHLLEGFKRETYAANQHSST